MSISRHSRQRGARATEKQVQAAVERLYRLFGCVVNNLSQPRATMQTPGIPDLYVLLPEKIGGAVWFEVKRPGGRVSRAQAQFHESCRRRGIAVIVGGAVEAKTHLASLGLVARVA